MVGRSDEIALTGPERDGRRAQIRLREPDRTNAVVLVMHGGKVTSNEGARWSHLSVARMQPFARTIWERFGQRDGVAVWSLLFARRGWNRTGAPIQDALWALTQIRRRYGEVPVILVGHSMGGRTAVRIAGEPSVVGVVGLAPWLPADEPTQQLAGRALSILHGTVDAWVPIGLSQAYVAGLDDVAVDLDFTALRASGHTMLRRARTWHRLTADAVGRMLADNVSGSSPGGAVAAPGSEHELHQG